MISRFVILVIVELVIFTLVNVRFNGRIIQHTKPLIIALMPSFGAFVVSLTCNCPRFRFMPWAMAVIVMIWCVVKFKSYKRYKRTKSVRSLIFVLSGIIHTTIYTMWVSSLSATTAVKRGVIMKGIGLELSFFLLISFLGILLYIVFEDKFDRLGVRGISSTYLPTVFLASTAIMPILF